jgi:hypothetical protein
MKGSHPPQPKTQRSRTSVRKAYFKVEDKRLVRELEPLTETLETVATAETGV